jgi:hypothetical protein
MTTTQPFDSEKDAPVSQGIRKAWRLLASVLNKSWCCLKAHCMKPPVDLFAFQQAAEQLATAGIVTSIYTELACLPLTTTGLGNATR